MPRLLPNLDPDGLLEYSVVYTDRALNHMSQSFQEVMKDIAASLKQVYHAEAVVVVPGSGTFAMEAVARQLATDQTCLVLRNGWFSYRWTQILEMGQIPAKSIILKAQPTEAGPHPAFAPVPLETAIATIKAEKPAIVFAPHVETSAGLILPNDYLKAVADAVHEVGGLFVLDCIASGTIWVDMEDCGIDVLISAPQKGWSSSPCCGLVMLSALAHEKVKATTSSSFACDLLKWLQIMEAYEKGGHAYHATMPTDALTIFRNTINETAAYGWEQVCHQQQELGRRVRALLSSKGMKSVAAEGFEAPSVIVSYTDDPEIHSGRKFKNLGMQIAAGVPLQCDEPADFQTFRIGLFGLDKLQNVDRSVAQMEAVLNQLHTKVEV